MRLSVHPDFKHLTDFITTLPETFHDNGEVLHEGRNCVKLYRINNTDIVVKRYKYPNIFQQITYSFFKKSKAERAYIFANLFRKKGINTPHEIAFIEEYTNGLIGFTYFISESCTLDSLKTTLDRDDFCKESGVALAEYIIKLHEKGILHGDMNLSNILFRNNIEGYMEFILIDTNRTKFKKNPSRKECLENMVRLTHHKPALEFIVANYSQKRGWNQEESVSYVLNKLAAFEKRKKIKRELKSVIKR